MNLHRISAEVVFQQWIQGKHGHGYLYHTACFKVIWDTWKKLCKFTTANSLWTKLIFQVWACYCVVFKCLVRTSVSGIPRQIHSGFILPLGLFSWPLSWELSIWSWSLPVSVLVHPCLYCYHWPYLLPLIDLLFSPPVFWAIWRRCYREGFIWNISSYYPFPAMQQQFIVCSGLAVHLAGVSAMNHLP